MSDRAERQSLITSSVDEEDPYGKGAYLVGLEKGQVSDDLCINISQDSYDAVVAAAFGGVRISLPTNDKGETQVINVHPIVILIFCLVLFMVQLSCMSCLIMDMDMGTKVSDVHEHHPSPNSTEFVVNPLEAEEHKMMVTVKVMMASVLQLIYLKEIVGALRPLFLVSNPVTWFELKRPNLEKTGWVFDARICAPICIIAKMMQFLIAYYVLSVSMSVIEAAVDVKEVVFNGLVVTFLADLDEYAWSAMAAVCHLDEKHFAEFQFSIESKQEQEVDKRREEARKSNWRIYFYRGKGGKAVVAESIIIFTFLAYMYIRQAFMLIQSTHTGILPVARDVCQLYRGLEEPTQHIGDYITLLIVDFFTVIDYKAMLRKTVTGKHLDQACFSEEYEEGPFIHALEYISWWPRPVLGAVLVIVLLFFVPQLLFANYLKVLSFFGRLAEQTDNITKAIKRTGSSVEFGQDQSTYSSVEIP